MKRTKSITSIIILLLGSFTLFAQSNDEVSIPVKSVFWGSRLVDQQTTETTGKGKYRIEILHRFGTVENGIEDIFGVYAPSNISMGLGYGISDRLEVEFQTEKNNKVQELGIKYKILQQDVSDANPLSLTYYFSLSADAHDSDYFGESYQFTDRLFYTNQLIASRQMRYKFMTMMTLSYVHFNSVDQSIQHDKMELNTAIGYKLTKKRSVFASYQIPWDVNVFNENTDATTTPKQGLCFGMESSTPTHNFQVFLSSRDNISLGKDLSNNQNEISLKNLRIGFNIRITLGGNKKHH